MRGPLPRWLMKLKRTPQNPCEARRLSSASSTEGGTSATPQWSPFFAAIASATTRLARAWQVEWTITQRWTPSIACSAKSFSFGASAGVNGRPSAKGKTPLGPNTCTCVSHAPAGSFSFGLLGEARNDGLGSPISQVFLEADRLDDGAPARLLLLEKSDVLRLRRRRRDAAHLAELVDQLGRAQCGDGGVVDARLHRRGRARRRDQAVPVVRDHPGVAELAGRRHVGQRRGALAAGQRERLELARPDVRQHHGDVEDS